MDVPGLQESAYLLSNATGPTVEMIPGVIDFDETMSRGMDSYSFTIRVTVGTSVDKAAQKRLRQFRSPSGPHSIKQAVEQVAGAAERTLGGLVYDLNVNRCSPVRQFRRPEGSTVMGCDFECAFEGEGEQDGV